MTGDVAALFARLREARVGGRFWADPAALSRPPALVVRPHPGENLSAHLDAMSLAERRGALWIHADGRTRRPHDRLASLEGGEWRGDVDPWSALAGAGALAAHGDDEWVAIARIVGIAVRLLSPGRFGTPGWNDTELDARAAQLLNQFAWRDPFTGEASTIEATIDLLAEWREIITANRPITVACGMAWWKRAEIRRFLWSPQRPLHIVARPRRALAVAKRSGGAVAIWPSRVSPALLAEARTQDVPLVRVEDGFVRSVGLGVALVPPSSVVVDRSGIHFDPMRPSDLEHILAKTSFSPRLLARAQALRQAIVAAGISKYAAGESAPAPDRKPASRLVLVPAQVEDDMSVLCGGGGLTSNLELLRRVRALEPDAEIWFRPHPDVDAGHRKGAVPDADVLAVADRIVREPAMATLLGAVDAVHVLTSLTGFEALLRGRAVTCHGTPFYAGWGLTRDLGAVPARRGRALALDELVAGVLILYPRYLDPVTGLPCPPEVLIHRMATTSTHNRLGWVAPLRHWQGRLMAALRGIGRP
ncbi:capsular polysaccharide export protein [Sphingopyxis panaciterrae]|uniref:capsular polysaccharide export protein, LipB/KpsS family n=1 Tax=Sphingopyxis panaciterrae TaxID=363841 RepID=UPI003132A74A|nr:capsular polysaccharide export protein [Sphingopyxis panaciterrae]